MRPHICPLPTSLDFRAAVAKPTMVSTSALIAAPLNSGVAVSAAIGRGGLAPTLTAASALARGGSVAPNHGPSFLAAGRRAGINISEEVAWTWLSSNPARSLGIFDQTGSLKAGKMADVVLWNGDPFSAYTRPDKVWIDGALLYDAANPKLRPVTDFELGQPGEGDVK